jgi:hypothetical protein
MFEHRRMVKAAFSSQGGQTNPQVEAKLKSVIKAFAQLQEDGHTADYDVGRIWSRVDVTNALAIADEAFAAWRDIRKEKIAQDHLLTMFGAR